MPHTYTRVTVAETSGLQQRGGDDVAEREKRHGRRDDEKRDLPKPGVEPSSKRPPAQRRRSATPDIAGSSAADDRHAEQADRQRVERRAFVMPVDRAGRQQAREQLIDVCAHLHDAAADEHRDEIADDGAHFGRTRGRARSADRARPAGRSAPARRTAARCRRPIPRRASLASARQRRPAPKMTSAAIIAAFHITGAVYDSRKR